MLTFAVPTLSCYDLLNACLASAEAGTVKPDRYVVIDNGGSLNELVQHGKVQLPANTHVETPGRNLGVAASWNYAIRQSEELTLICNDDITLAPDTLERLVKAATVDDPGGVFYHPEICAWSCFLIRRRLVDAIGWFDEGFHPAYFEDNDYHWRMQIAGFDVNIVQGCFVASHVGSATIKRARPDGFDEQFERNRERYIKKWGGLPSFETLRSPGC